MIKWKDNFLPAPPCTHPERERRHFRTKLKAAVFLTWEKNATCFLTSSCRVWNYWLEKSLVRPVSRYLEVCRVEMGFCLLSKPSKQKCCQSDRNFTDGPLKTGQAKSATRTLTLNYFSDVHQSWIAFRKFSLILTTILSTSCVPATVQPHLTFTASWCNYLHFKQKELDASSTNENLLQVKECSSFSFIYE